MKTLVLPYNEEELLAIRAGDELLVSGILHVGRDQVHRRLVQALEKGDALPFDFASCGIYYMGPSPAPDGWPIGAAGPTTSARMDPYSPLLMEHGLRLMIGKGPRGKAVEEAIVRTRSVYLQAYGGCGALYAECIESVETVAYPELGPEALLRLSVRAMPAICMLDAWGGKFQRV